MAEQMPATTPFEARLPCPVCLGVQMEKVALGTTASQLMLDHCTRCGGVWFEKGEAQQLARLSPSELWKHIPPRKEIPKPPCHGCHAPLDRDAVQCEACGTLNVLSCPSCDRMMERKVNDNLVLDICSRCKGVWFDHAELRSVWTLVASQLDRPRSNGAAEIAAVGGDVLLESLFWAPGLTLQAGAAVAQGLGSAVGAIGSISAEGAAGAAMGAVEVAGEAAEGVFEFIMNIIASIFDGS
jgi:Zn-finger nucleic acid-binding protein